MILRVDPASAVPVYEQLRVQVTTMVATGQLAPGTQLPTIRQLAADLGVAKGTISKAYDELLRADVIVSDGRRGTRVADAPAAHSRPAEAARELRSAAEQFAVTVHQLGVDPGDARTAIDDALERIRAAR